MARLYADENFPLPVVEELRRLGHDIETCWEAGHASQATADAAILDHAHREGRALLTLNRLHFIRLHKAKAKHVGIVVCSFDPDFAGLAERIHEAVGASETIAGELLRVNRPNP
ncbi:MAG: DUF5615 family PIN-like protein [Deltaproteobacteria bacterium]|nr:DUF5615 family PIN-like protein [Deltaproteobacteria bacterium]